MLPFALTIFLSAFLLFLVQPLIAKQILPWFGGAAGVWATCLVFFQAALLAGYAYADALIRWCVPRRQALVHTVLVAVSLSALPIVASGEWKPAGDEEPIWRILGLLAATIGLPYLVLATTTPLLQAWYWRRYESVVPYRLFALSNFASLLALLGYPLLMEPWFTLKESAYTWSWLYALFAVLCVGTAWWSLRTDRGRPAGTGASERAGPAGTTGSAAGEGGAAAVPPSWSETPPTRGTVLTWLALSAMGSCLLLAVTNHITQNIASVPFLWVLPLSLYLVSFILVFDHPRWYQRGVWLFLLAVFAIAMAAMIDSLDLYVAAPLYAGGMFVACMYLHGELASLKPAPRYLTRFYLAMSVGGALGAILVGIVAPLVLPGYYELGILLVLLCGLVILRLFSAPILLTFVAVGVSGVVALLVAVNLRDYAGDVRVLQRDFYGVVRTRDKADPVDFRVMYHGGIMHGGQLLQNEHRRMPSTYFGPTSGYGRLFASLPEAPRKVGIIGLGAGAIAGYSRAGDTFVFYEIDPIVVDIARREFTFLSDSPGKIEVVLGDGRLSLEREAPRGFDVLAVDAFSGDSIPLHLLTREAMAIYARHLEPDGAIVFQATNRFIDIVPVIRRLAAEAGMEAVLVSDSPDSAMGPEYWYSSTDQVIVTRNRALLAAEPIREAAEEIADRPELRTFTDDYTNLFRILRR
jgi:spermidine synthase